MRSFKTEAVIFDTADVFDADRSLLLFTREFGKARARAKGVRRPTSKLTGHLLHFIPAQLEMVESGGWFLITQAQILTKYSSTSLYPVQPLSFLRQAAVLAEALDRLFLERDPHPVVYDGLVYTLERLRELHLEQPEGFESTAELLVAEFLMKALAELGYRAELHRCVATGQPVTEQFIAWSGQLGGVLTEEGLRQAQGQGRVVKSPRSIVLLRQFLEPEFRSERLAVADEVRQEASSLVFDYVQNQIGQPLRSLRY